MEASKAKTVNRVATHQPAAAAVVARAPTSIQTATRVSSPSDPAEREASATAKQITRMSAPVGALHRTPAPTAMLRSPHVARFTDVGPWKQDRGASPKVSEELSASMSGGTQLSTGVRNFMEPRFGADFSRVRVHTDPRAAGLNRQVQARAFTYGSHVFFGRGQYQPETQDGRELIAHELTHTIQQGGGVQRSEDLRVHEHASERMVQRVPGVESLLESLAESAYALPGFRMFTLVLGVNPISMQSVDRSAANLLRAVVEFMPGGVLVTQALDNYGVFDRAGEFIDGQLQSLGLSGATIKQSLLDFLGTLGLASVLELDEVWENAKRIITEPIERIIAFIGSLAGALLDLIKDAILAPLAALAAETPAWDLLCAVLGKNPITGEEVPQTAEALIGGFMRLIGQDEIWENIKKANAIARCRTWLDGAITGLLAFVRQVPALFVQALESLEIVDIVFPPAAFVKVAKVFGTFAVSFVKWAGSAVWSLLEIVFEVVAPALMPYLKKAAGAFQTILKDPIGFVGNLVGAGKLGFSQFAGNFLDHLKKSLIGWLTGSLAGTTIYIPQALTLAEFGKFVLSVLDVTWPKIRAKIVKVLGPKGETLMQTLETGFEIITALIKGGPAAAWDLIKEKLTDLKDMLLESITSFVTEKVVTAAVTKLASMLTPAGAFIQAILGIYNTVMFFVERLAQIAAVAASFIDSIAAIASGAISAAANRVEQTMAGLLTLVISFLARIAGLGKVTDKVVALVKKLQAKVDKALDAVIAWIVTQAKRLLSSVLGGDPDAPSAQRVQAGMTEAEKVMSRYADRRVARTVLAPLLTVIKARHRLTRLEAIPSGEYWTIVAAASPDFKKRMKAKIEGESTASRTKITYGNLTKFAFNNSEGMVATKMQAHLNPAYPEKGSNTASSTAFSDLFRMLTQNTATTWVRGHLLNHDLGGVANYNNLFPITTAANGTHYREVELPVKNWLTADCEIDYSVTAKQDQPNEPSGTFECDASVTAGPLLGQRIAKTIRSRAEAGQKEKFASVEYGELNNVTRGSGKGGVPEEWKHRSGKVADNYELVDGKKLEKRKS